MYGSVVLGWFWCSLFLEDYIWLSVVFSVVWVCGLSSVVVLVWLWVWLYLDSILVVLLNIGGLFVVVLLWLWLLWLVCVWLVVLAVL